MYIKFENRMIYDLWPMPPIMSIYTIRFVVTLDRILQSATRERSGNDERKGGAIRVVTHHHDAAASILVNTHTHTMTSLNIYYILYA